MAAQAPLELELSAEEKAAIEDGLGRADGDAQEALGGAEGAPRGRQQMDRHRRHQPLRRLRLQPAGHPHRPGQGPQPQRSEGLGPTPVQGLRRPARTRHPQHQGRCAGCAASPGRGLELDLDDTIRSTAAMPAGWTSRWCRAAQQGEGAAADGRGRHHGRAHPPRRGDVQRRQSEFKHLEFYYFHNCVYDFLWKNNRRRYGEVSDLGRDPQVQQGLAAVHRRRDHEPPTRSCSPAAASSTTTRKRAPSGCSASRTPSPSSPGSTPSRKACGATARASPSSSS